MATKIVRYIACNRICPCETTSIYLCLDPSLILSGKHTIPATIVGVATNTECCSTGNTISYTYTFSYDDAPLIGSHTLTTDEIEGVVCNDCYALWVKDQVDILEDCCCIEDNTNTVCGCYIFDPTLPANFAAQRNTAFGYAPLSELAPVSHGDDNTAIGAYAATAIMDGWRNTAVGAYALTSSSYGSYHTAIGYRALGADVAGIYNTAVGGYALRDNVFGSYNSALGVYSLASNEDGEDNTAVGASSMANNTSGSNNVSVGYYALAFNSIGSNNVAVGAAALGFSEEGDYNVAVGIESISWNFSGSCNTAVGSYSFGDNGGGDYNVALGYRALSVAGLDDCFNTVAIGAFSAYEEGVFTNCVFVGHEAGGIAAQVAGLTNSVAIGYRSFTTKSNQVVIGNSSIIETSLRRVLLSAGSTAVGSYPIKFLTGPLLTAPEAGTIEFDGTHFYMTKGGGTRQQITT